MRCEEFENDIAEYLKGTLPTDSASMRHLAGCARCRNEVQELQEVWNDLARLEVPPSSAAMPANLASAIAETKLVSTRRTPMPLIKPFLLIAFIGTALFLGRSLEQPISNDGATHYRGAATAPVTLTEYGDYQCPSCFPYNAILNEVIAKYPDKVRLEFRHFPLARHANALKAALAVEAAGQQGHYWEMHDLVLSSQEQWARLDNVEQVFAKLAASIGLDPKRLVEVAAKPETQQRVEADMAIGKQLNVGAVPTFFINGRRINPPPQTAQDFFAVIDMELRKQ
jgi:protein-disulfide isomerase